MKYTVGTPIRFSKCYPLETKNRVQWQDWDCRNGYPETLQQVGLYTSPIPATSGVVVGYRSAYMSDCTFTMSRQIGDYLSGPETVPAVVRGKRESCYLVCYHPWRRHVLVREQDIQWP